MNSFQAHGLPARLLSWPQDAVTNLCVWTLRLIAFVSFGCLAANPAPALAQVTAISISATPDPVKPGERVFYTVTITNRTANTVNGWLVSATVPDHTTVIWSDRSGGNCSSLSTCGPGATISWNIPNLGAGQSESVTFAALVDSVNAPPNGTLLHSVATVASNNAGGGASASSDVVVSAAPPMLMGLVDGPDPAAPGAPLTYTLTYGNPSGVTSPAGVLSMAVPTGTTFSSATAGGTLVGNTVQWTIGALASGASGQRQLAVQVDAGTANGSVVLGTADWRDSATAQSLARANAATAVAAAPVAAITLSATPDPVKPGERVFYTVTITNRTANTVNGWLVSATVPDHTTVIWSDRSGGNCSSLSTCGPGATISWNIPNLGAGQSESVTFAALVDSVNAPPNGTLLHSVATVASNNAGGGASASSDVVVKGGPSTAIPVLSFTPSSLAFGSVNVGTSKDIALTVTNSGGGTLTGTASGSASFPVVSGASFNLAAAQSQDVTVRFMPASATGFASQVLLSTNGGNASVAVNGTGVGVPVPVPLLTLSTNVVAFAPTVAGNFIISNPIKITSTGNSNLLLGVFSIEGTNPGDFGLINNACDGATLLPTPLAGSSCSFSILFKPIQAGTRSATVRIPSNAQGGPHSVGASGTGLAPDVSLIPDRITFHDQPIGTVSTVRSVTVTNIGNANLDITNLTISGVNLSDYQITGDGCTGVILTPLPSSTSSCSFDIVFRPTALGARMGSVNINSNFSNNPLVVPLLGNGVQLQAPNAPTGLWGTVGNKQIVLGWETSNRGVDGWKVYIKTPLSPSGFTVIPGTPTKATILSVTRDSQGNDLQAGIVYEFAIAAVSRGLEGPKSATLRLRFTAPGLPKPNGPVLFLHGFLSSASTWNTIKDYLQSVGWKFGGELVRNGNQLSLVGGASNTSGDFFTANFRAFDGVDCATPVCGLGHIAMQAGEIPEFLDKIKQEKFGARNAIFTIVAHSNGGLAARYYLTSQQYKARQDVSHLAIYGTPNLGATLLALSNYANDATYSVCRAVHDAQKLIKLTLSPGDFFLGELNDYLADLALRALTPAAVDATSGSDFLNNLNNLPVPAATRYTLLIGAPPQIQSTIADAASISTSLGCQTLTGILSELRVSDGLVSGISQFGIRSVGGNIFPPGPNRRSIQTQSFHFKETSDVPHVLQAIGRPLTMLVRSPVDLEITGPDGALLTKTFNEIPGAAYKEFLNEQDHKVGLIIIPFAVTGNYAIKVVPKQQAAPTDTYTVEITLDGASTVLVQDQQVQNIPPEGFTIVVQPGSQPPTANAGPIQTVRLGSLVTLDGSASSDPDNGPSPLTYQWTQSSGPSSALSNASFVKPSFTPSTSGSYTFTLTVSDGVATSGQSLSDQVMNSALKYRVQAPLVDSLLKDIGLDGLDAESVAKALRKG